jgi:N-terminal domain of anti-restriction factor ArdC
MKQGRKMTQSADDRACRRDVSSLFHPSFRSVSTMPAVIDRERMQQDALGRAIGNQSTMNYGAIFDGFMEKGIPESDILPRENVFTYHAWRALGRQVRRGEHGVKVTTWIPTERKERDETTGEVKVSAGRICHTAVVFHVSQTDPIAK